MSFNGECHCSGTVYYYKGTVNSGHSGFPGDNVEWPFWTERRFIQVRPRGVGTDASEFNCITS